MKQNTKQCMAFLFSNWCFIISEKCMVYSNFLFAYQKYLLSSTFSGGILLSLHGFKPCQNIPVLVGTTHRKPGYLDRRKIYAQ